MKHYFSFKNENKFSLVKRMRYIGNIYQYKLNGEFIAKYDSIKDLSKEFGRDMSSVTSMINSKRCYLGFQWNNIQEVNMENLEINEFKGVPKKVGQYTLNNELVKIFDTVTECKKEFTNVRKVLKGILPQTKNFIFKYIE